MNKELIDRAWACLPREFREEVKKRYKFACQYSNLYSARGTMEILELLFGKHNLTSDAEGEEDEMLYVSRKQVQEVYRNANEGQYDQTISSETRTWCNGQAQILVSLFGSKCLPDNVDSLSQNPTEICDNESHISPGCDNLAEPKFKRGDMVIYKWTGKKKVVVGMDKYGRYMIALPNMQSPMHANESDLEPYTEPKEESPQMKPIESKVSVYLATKEEDEEFRLLLYKNGFLWKSGDSLISDSRWTSASEENKIHYVYPDKIVAYCGDKTSDTLAFSEFKKRYFEFKKRHFDEDVNLSKNVKICDKQFDNILKDSFSKERRLNIAAMITQGIMANPNPQMVEMDVHRVVDLAILMADTLIAEAEEGGAK